MEYSLEKIRILTIALKCRISFATMENIREELPEIMHTKNELDKEIQFYHQNFFRKTNSISYYQHYCSCIYSFKLLRDAVNYQENQLGCGKRKGVVQGDACFLFGPEYKKKRKDKKDYFFSPEFEKICKQYNKLNTLPLFIIYPKTMAPKNEIDYQYIIEDENLSSDIRDIINIIIRKNEFNQKIEEIKGIFCSSPKNRLEQVSKVLDNISEHYKIFIKSTKTTKLTKLDKNSFEMLNKIFIYYIEKENMRHFQTRLNRLGKLHFNLFYIYANTSKNPKKELVSSHVIDNMLFNVYKYVYNPEFFAIDGSIPPLVAD